MGADRSCGVYLQVTREFLMVARNMTREAVGRKQDVVSASRARVFLSKESIRQSRERTVRLRQRGFVVEAAGSTTAGRKR